MLKNTEIWIGNYLKQTLQRQPRSNKNTTPTHIFFCFVDHFEPHWNKADVSLQLERVRAWVEKYPQLADKHKDADGYSPRHTFFYPAEVYTKEHLELLAQICHRGYGEVEVHLHHDNDTAPSLKEKLEKAKMDFARHGLLGKDKSGEIRYGFIHGNWALNNSRKDGKWCGVNNESQILKETGCYADFTLPSAPSETQTRMINSLYYDQGSKEKPKSHDTGINVKAGKTMDGLMIIQGPLTFNWKRRKYGIIPKIENSDISSGHLPSDDRVDLWVEQRISVEGKPDWIFIKVHTHGAVEKNTAVLLGDPMDKMCSYLETRYNDGRNFVLHYVTARELYNIIKAAETNQEESPAKYRDFLIQWPN